MADDIVTRIREEAKKQTTPGQAFDLLHVADEIERLRAAGDALAKVVTGPCQCVETHDGEIIKECASCTAFYDWQEARRG